MHLERRGGEVTGRWHPDELHLLGDTRGALLKSVTVSALCGGDLLLTLELSEKRVYPLCWVRRHSGSQRVVVTTLPKLRTCAL